jgi:hypothetical protein
LSTLLQELKRIITQPSKYANSFVFGLSVAMVLLGCFGFGVNLTLGHPFNTLIFLVLIVVYGILGYKYSPWR